MSWHLCYHALMQLILASGSQNRQQALNLAKIPYKAVPADIDEKAIQHDDLKTRIVNIAKAKVEAVAQHHQGLILGADGVNVCNEELLEKPVDKKDAIRMLKLQSGQQASFLTGYYLLNTNTKKTYQGFTESKYQFRDLTNQEIERYVDSEPVFSWAAAFSPINSMGVTFIEWMHGSPSQFCFSMPFEEIVPILKQEGIV